jgi:hypothetical protein
MFPASKHEPVAKQEEALGGYRRQHSGPGVDNDNDGLSDSGELEVY